MGMEERWNGRTNPPSIITKRRFFVNRNVGKWRECRQIEGQAGGGRYQSRPLGDAGFVSKIERLVGRELRARPRAYVLLMSFAQLLHKCESALLLLSSTILT
jgi:hypothetical protein